MRLRNKKTGVIGEVGYISTSTGDILVSNIHDQEEWYHYKSLAGLNAEWEDYKEPKPWWYIDITLDVKQGELFLSKYLEEFKTVGNYFETREEAELAVRKLKAWKRLRDSKIKFCLDFVMNKIVFTYVIGKNTTVDAVDAERQIFEDMKIVFGGEE